MPFVSGNQLGVGGDHGGGRPSIRELRETIKACDKARARLERNVDKIMGSYLRFVGKDPATARHAVDKILPDEQRIAPAAAVIQFIQFNNQNPAQLPAEGLSTAVLVSDEQREEESGEGLASKKWKRQDGLEFHSFTNVPGKRG